MKTLLDFMKGAAILLFSGMLFAAFIIMCVALINMPTTHEGRRACLEVAGDSVEDFAECLEVWREHQAAYRPFGE